VVFRSTHGKGLLIIAPIKKSQCFFQVFLECYIFVISMPWSQSLCGLSEISDDIH